MTKRMLIDATQPEETRVVVVDGNRVDDFDFETANRRQLKGNIYLARVTRVEPSLQAAFVEYGGNRHGFLAFGEIHPDYYRIPMEDRVALAAEDDHEARDPDDDLDEPGDSGDGDEDADGGGDAGAEDAPAAETAPEGEAEADNGDAGPAGDAAEENGGDGEEAPPARAERAGRAPSRRDRAGRRPSRRRYKIQEVITRRQVLLVQVVKEERGNKGAALTTYLSLAGRYCVLMPNTARGGGVSRKITNAADRKRLKQVVEGLDTPEGMAIIVRTAGSQRTKTEIKRDREYLLRLWDRIREQTLVSTAPCLVHEEANLIKRSIRDLYTRDIEEVLVEGDEGYRTAKAFMKMLIPSHARRVQPSGNGAAPLLRRFHVEDQLEAVHAPDVQLRSGGYLVLNQTEALVAIDVNSGRATRARNIEETALRTNLEAAEEIARQLRLRDLAGLIVIDFIDMDDSRNQHAVERRMKEATKIDRARVQLGRISQFGLMELSRQRLRPSVIEASTVVCPRCEGTGRVRSVESAALQVLRGVEEEGLKRKASRIAVHVPSTVGFYILNRKRAALSEAEERYAFEVTLEPDEALLAPEHRIERLAAKAPEERRAEPEAADAEPAAGEDGEAPRERPGRRRRRRSDRRRADGEAAPPAGDSEAVEDGSAPEEAAGAEAGDGEDDDANRARRRRGRRGGRRRARRAEGEEAAPETADAEAAESGEESAPAAEAGTDADGDEGADEAKPRKRAVRTRRSRRRAAPAGDAEVAPEKGDAASAEPEAAPVEAGAGDDAPAAAEDSVAEAGNGDGSAPVEAEAAASEPGEAAPPPSDGAGEPEEDVAKPAGVTVAIVAGTDRAPAEEETAEAHSAPPAPPRRGWWNRLLS